MDIVTDTAARLRAELGDIVVTGADIPPRHHADWSGLGAVVPLALARPRTTEEAAAVVRLAAELGLPVVPQGGLTGLSGGARPVEGGIVISLDRMAAIEDIDPVMATMTVQCGVTLGQVQRAAEENDLFFGVDLGARDSCTIGGNIGTNAGGNRVVRYGMMRDNVLGIEAVLPDGSVLSSMNRLLKNNAGYDVKQMLIGAEGTLGLVTRAVLKLQARPRTVSCAFCGVPDFAAVTGLLQAARRGLGPGLTAFEVMWPGFFDFMSAGQPHLRRPLSGSHGLYVILEASGIDPELDPGRFEALLGEAMEAGLISDAVLAGSEREMRELWAIRESTAEYGRLIGPIIAFDVGLPTAETGRVVTAIETALAARWPGVIALAYGHIGDSNLHLVINVPSAGADQPYYEVTELVLGMVGAAGGTVSAEHGIGLTKKPWLHLSRSEGELALMARFKAALDPQGIFNPGKVLGG